MGRFSDIRGNGLLKKALAGMVDGGRIPHALLMHENDGGSALRIALAFLQYAFCEHHADGDSCGECPSCRQFARLTHPDVHFTFPITAGSKVRGKASDLVCENFLEYWRKLCLENPYFLESDMNEALGFEKKRGQILVSEGGAILRKLSLSAVSGIYRAIVIYLPELINVQTANKLLKAIEEPAEGTVFILITHSPENVLGTIRSRCQPVRVLPLGRDDVAGILRDTYSFSAEDARNASAISGGSVGVALREYAARDDVLQLRALLRELLSALAERRLSESLETGEKVAALESREKQKLFCTFAADALRNLFLMKQGMGEMCGVQAEERDFLAGIASRCGAQFSRRGLAAFDRAAMLIDRNVSQKIVFANLVARLYRAVK